MWCCIRDQTSWKAVLTELDSEIHPYLSTDGISAIGFSCYRTIDSFTRVLSMVRKELLIIWNGSSCCHGHGFCKTLFGNLCATRTLNLQVPGTPVESRLEENSIKERTNSFVIFKSSSRMENRNKELGSSCKLSDEALITAFESKSPHFGWAICGSVELKKFICFDKCVRLGTIRMLV